MSNTPNAEIVQKLVSDTGVTAPIVALDKSEKFRREFFGEAVEQVRSSKQIGRLENESVKGESNQTQMQLESSLGYPKILPILQLDVAKQLPKDDHVIPMPDDKPHPGPIRPIDIPVPTGGFDLKLHENAEVVKARAEVEQLRREVASLKSLMQQKDRGNDNPAIATSDLPELPKKVSRAEQTEAIPITTKEQFDKLVLHSDGPVIVDFNATWCGPCRAMKPNVDALAREYSGRASVYSVDVDAAAAAANGANWTQQYAQALPTISYFNSGKELTPVVGGTSYSALKEHTENELQKASHINGLSPERRTSGDSVARERNEIFSRADQTESRHPVEDSRQMSDAVKTAANPEGRYYIDDQNGGMHIPIDSPMAAAFLRRYAATHHCGGDKNGGSVNSGGTGSAYDGNYYAGRGRRHESDRRVSYYSSEQSHSCGRGCRH